MIYRLKDNTSKTVFNVSGRSSGVPSSARCVRGRQRVGANFMLLQWKQGSMLEPKWPFVNGHLTSDYSSNEVALAVLIQ